MCKSVVRYNIFHAHEVCRLSSYLPPPVLAILDNQRIEASKRAALLTTALKWLLDHIPTAAIPPQARPALQLLGTLVPYLAYLGAFVVWSWSAIKTFDKGAQSAV